jgi:hypothetical protein
MKRTTPHSLSNQEANEPKKPHPWLLKHYEEKRERTARLVKTSVDQLVKEGKIVTIDAICRVSPGLDPEGRGVKKSAILENPEAHEYYREHSTSYQTAKNRNRRVVRKRTSAALAAQPLRIDPQRDVERVRYRYIQMTKAEIVERLLMIEQAYAEAHQQLAQLQFQLIECEEQQEEEQRLVCHQTQ